MIIIQLNCTYNIGSTGKIAKDIDSELRANGHESYIVCAFAPKDYPNNVYVSEPHSYIWMMRKDILISRLTGKMGYRDVLATKKMLRWIEDKHPDVIHLQNIHGDWINLRLLFDFIKKKKYPVVWTLHDCWNFTGRCSHFELFGCSKWKNGCHDCKQRNIYPITYFFDFSKKMWKDKKRWFTGIENMTLVTPSKWLGNYARLSFLGAYPIKTIGNGIDLSLFKPAKEKSLKMQRCFGKKIILGVANSWSQTKGLDDFMLIDSMLNHEHYQIVLVGLNDRQMKSVPETILKIKRTNNQAELAQIYSEASVFVNPTYQDNYPTTNMEAIACGTPVVTYKTGGSPENVMGNENVISQGDVNGLYKRIVEVCNLKKDRDALRIYAEKHFSKEDFAKKYVSLYCEMLKKEAK